MANEIMPYTGRIDDIQQVAKVLALSGYFKTTGNLEVAIAQMAVKILAGKELGFGPFASATGIEIIQGRPAVGARLIAAAIKANPKYNYRIRRADAEECTIEFFEHGESVGTATYTIAEARSAGLAGKENWKGYPSDMLFARCISRGQRRFCPDVFSGASVYTPEELGAVVDADGVIVEMPAHAEVAFMQPEPVAEDEPPDPKRVNMNELGESIHGPSWPAKRKNYAKKISDGRTDVAADLTDDEVSRLTVILADYLTAKQHKPEAGTVTA